VGERQRTGTLTADEDDDENDDEANGIAPAVAETAFLGDRQMAGNDAMKVGVVGYGPTFGMGKHHLTAMQEAGFAPTAVCDIDEKRLEAARQDFPGIETYSDVGDLLRKSQVELLTLPLPHNIHASVAIRCLNAGRHVITEKPFAMTVEECDKVIAAAKRNKRMLSVYHNRHWDANILTIMKHLHKIGRPFRWESFAGGYNKPREWWRSNKKISGGAIFDWGAHFMEWMLQVMQYEMTEISGHGVKEVWMHATNEDEMEAVVRFKGNAVASHQESFIAAAGKPAIRICGTKGAIVASNASVTIHTQAEDGSNVATTVPMEKRAHENFYRNIHDHLTKGAPLIITPEHARRVIQILDYACRSAKTGKAMKAKYA
jgi:scyllo-inositol 2-dehydrogenase (NADP+)